MKGSNSTYFGNIKEAVGSLLEGLRLSFRHLREATESRKPVGIEEDTYFEQQSGIVTLQYPKEHLPVPDNGRYQLHNEIEDCIVCDKCAKVCPVNCIDIEPVKAVEEIGRTSDGTPKRLYAAKFDIDMGKCCFCGLCTTVCPTECLTMTKNYDFSAYDSADHIFPFAEMSPLEILQKKKELEEHNRQKEAQKAAKPAAARPKPAIAKPAGEGSGEAKSAPKPAFKPKIKQAPQEGGETAASKAVPSQEAPSSGQQEGEEKAAAPKPRFRPKIKTAPKPAEEDEQVKSHGKPDTVANGKEGNASKETDSKGVAEKAPAENRPKPVIKPKIQPSAKAEQKEPEGAESKAAKPARPLVRPKIQAKKEGEEGAPSEETKKTPPVVKPTGLPKKPSEEEKSESDKEEEKKVNPAYRPKPVIRKKKDE